MRTGVRRTAVLAGAIALALALPRLAAAAPAAGADPHTRHAEILSEPYTIDRIYKSMAGPESQKVISIWQPEPPELLWITGYRVVVVGADGKAPVSQEFMCHNNLDLHPVVHSKLFDAPMLFSPRLFTLSQGEFAIDLPRGFGLPVMSNEPLYLSTQVLNHNRKDINIQVRHKVTIDFVRDKELTAPLRPLFPAAGFVVALLEGKDGNFGMSHPEGVQGHASCLPGLQAPDSKYSNVVFTDSDGRKATGHWVVKQGHEERHTLITPMMRLPYDTMLHFVGVHLHPFATSLELRDLTDGKTVFKSRARGPKQGIGLAHVDAFASQEGIPVYKSHDYELVSVYDNTSPTEQDAMATMFFYLEDKGFKKPAVAQ